MTSYTTGDAGGLIGLAQIARMANVSSSLVIHWRKTRSDFPDPAGRGARGELYEPGAVLDWLDRNGRLDRGTAAVAQVWAVADTLRDRVGPSDYLLIVLSALADQDPPPAIADQLTGAEWVAVSTGIRDVVNEADRSAVATTVAPRSAVSTMRVATGRRTRAHSVSRPRPARMPSIQVP